MVMKANDGQDYIVMPVPVGTENDTYAGWVYTKLRCDCGEDDCPGNKALEKLAIIKESDMQGVPHKELGHAPEVISQMYQAGKKAEAAVGKIKGLGKKLDPKKIRKLLLTKMTQAIELARTHPEKESELRAALVAQAYGLGLTKAMNSENLEKYTEESKGLTLEQLRDKIIKVCEKEAEERGV